METSPSILTSRLSSNLEPGIWVYTSWLLAMPGATLLSIQPGRRQSRGRSGEAVLHFHNATKRITSLPQSHLRATQTWPPQSPLCLCVLLGSLPINGCSLKGPSDLFAAENLISCVASRLDSSTRCCKLALLLQQPWPSCRHQVPLIPPQEFLPISLLALAPGWAPYPALSPGWGGEIGVLQPFNKNKGFEKFKHPDTQFYPSTHQLAWFFCIPI